MKIMLNNKEVATQATHIGQLVEELALPRMGVAIAVNNKLVPRTQWDTTPLAEGMSLVVIKAACGG